jgi:predicted acyl esterase
VLGRKGYKLTTKAPVPSNYIEQEIDYLDRDGRSPSDPAILDSAIQSEGKLVFVSDPLEKNRIMTGSFQAMIAATINKKDLDIIIDLYEWQPDGKYFYLSTFLGRASYAKDRSRRQLLQPGREEWIPARNSYFVSRQLNKGSRIVAVIGMNNNPSWQLNYGSGKDVSDETIKDGAIPLNIKWSTKSYIKLPLDR